MEGSLRKFTRFMRSLFQLGSVAMSDMYLRFNKSHIDLLIVSTSRANFYLRRSQQV